jgi:dihydroorotate dehydrogenase (fumarate)
MIDLTTTYLGLELRNPLVCAASTLGQDVNNLERMEDAGAAAVVLPSLFEEQIALEGMYLDLCLSIGADSYAEAASYFPDMTGYNTGPDGYLELVLQAKRRLEIPVIGSLNGSTRGGWLRYARLIEEAGADALELNVYDLPTEPADTATAVERRLLELVRDVCGQVRIPVAVKLSPFFTAPANLGRRLAAAGAAGLVLFNRFYQPDFDVENLEVEPHLRLSSSDELPLRLHWAAILYGQVKADLAITGGVHSARDVAKSMMSGASVVQIASVLYRRGIDYLSTLQGDFRAWLETHEYESARQMRGSLSLRHVADPAAYVRANYMKLLQGGAVRHRH